MSLTRLFRATTLLSKGLRQKPKSFVPTEIEDSLSRIDFILGFSKQGKFDAFFFFNIVRNCT